MGGLRVAAEQSQETDTGRSGKDGTGGRLDGRGGRLKGWIEVEGWKGGRADG